MAEKTISFELKSDLSELDILEEKLEEFCQQLVVTKKCYCEINLALEELFTNIVSYAFNDEDEHCIKFTIHHKDDTVTMTIEDDGKPFNILDTESPDTQCPVEKRNVGGLGIHLIKNIMDQIDYKRSDGKNLLTLIKNL